MKKNQTATQGICKLTNQRGKYIKSHIIPAALTRPSLKGNCFLQFGENQRQKKRWSSWYDPELVTAEGEKYLTDLDTWAVKVLRKHKLVWSGWNGQAELDKNLHNTDAQFGGIRIVEGIDPIKIRLFFLSILWRIAATNLNEFSYAVLPKNDLEYLRLMIINNNPEPQSFYPFQLTQLVTKGFMHNHAGVKMDLQINSGGYNSFPIFRLYFDGLIIYVYLGLKLPGSIDKLKGILVGSSNSLIVTTVPFDHSLQFKSIQEAFTRNKIGSI